ncbi:hypothetical protein ACFVYA_36420 [Amycolatopsis sp. NPDC058278]|uniref:hypothetical protein n=1 Tax=Amycolatopsis sp. NPDC058278 TaxID=3346417 RepID=UPI0036DB89B4
MNRDRRQAGNRLAAESRSRTPAGAAPRAAVFRCLVTDAAGSMASTPTVTVTFEQEWGD